MNHIHRKSTKGILLASIVFCALPAKASWYQIHCSNGEGTTRWSEGHNDNSVTVTKRTWDDQKGTWVDKKINVADYNVSITVEQPLESEASSSCDSNDGVGMVTWRDVSYRRVSISNADGSAFHKNVVGVSLDLRSVEASLICEEHGNSQTSCKVPTAPGGRPLKKK